MEKITISNEYTKKEAFVKFIEICRGLPSSLDYSDENSIQSKLVKFLGIEELVN